MRVALDEPILAATKPGASFAVGREVRVLERATLEEADVYSAETGGVVLEQPLVTDDNGQPVGPDDTVPWAEEGSYTLVVLPKREGDSPQTLYWEAAKGGGSAGISKAELEAHAADTTAIHGIADTAQLATLADVATRQAADADLTAIAALAPKDGAILTRSGGSWAALEAGSPGQELIVRTDGTIAYVNESINVEAWGAVPDEYFTDGKAVSGSATFTSASAKFTAADVGKTVVILRAGPSSGQDHHSTIKEVKSGTEVVLNNNAGRSQEKCRFYISRAGDQTAKIQAAIDAGVAAGGRKVFCPGVGYLASSLTLGNRGGLFGTGMFSTMLHQVHGTNAPLIVPDNTFEASANGCSVQDMWLDGARARQSDVTTTLASKYVAGETTIKLTDASKFLPIGMVIIGTNRIHYTSKSGNELKGCKGGYEDTTDAEGAAGATVTQKSACGIYAIRNPENAGGTWEEVYDSHHLFRNLKLKNFKADGIQAWGQSDILIEHCWAKNCDEYGFRPSYDTYLSNNIADTTGRAGFYSKGSSTSGTQNKAFNCGGVTATAGYGFFFEGFSGQDNEGTKTWSACNSQDNKADGYYFRNTDRVNVQGSASSNGTGGPVGTYCGVKLDGCRYSLIDITCTERQLDGVNSWQQNALVLLSTSRNCSGNQIRITHGRSGGTATVGKAIKEGADLTGGNDIRINGMGGTISPAYAAKYTPDPYAATTHLVGTLTGNITIEAPSNAHLGCPLTLVFTQDATGGRVVTFDAAFSVGGIAIGRSPNASTSVTFVYNGTKWVFQNPGPAAHRVLTPDVVAFSPDWHIPAGTASVGSANNWLGTICRVPKTGELRDLAIYVHTASGNVAVSVYNVATGGNNRTRKYASGSIACPAQGWRIIADPKLVVVEGELITLGFSCDNITAAFGRYDNYPSASAAELPAGFIPEGSLRLATMKSASFPDAGETLVGPSSTTLEIIVVGRIA